MLLAFVPISTAFRADPARPRVVDWSAPKKGNATVRAPEDPHHDGAMDTPEHSADNPYAWSPTGYRRQEPDRRRKEQEHHPAGEEPRFLIQGHGTSILEPGSSAIPLPTCVGQVQGCLMESLLDLGAVRRRYAEAVCATGNVTYRPIFDAFAAVPRERFLFAGPWKLPLPGSGAAEDTPDDDPRHIYVDRLVSLDASKNLNNGVPSFWAGVFEHLKPTAGERAIHAGAGTGYYTAILAHLVGKSGTVLGIEFEPHLAAHAVQAFSGQQNVDVLQGDALTLAHGAADVIVASAGLDAVPLPWVHLLNDRGRLLVPLTAPSARFGDRIGGGGMLLISRTGAAYEARFVGGTFIYHFMGSRSAESGERLAQALSGVTPAAEVRSLLLDSRPDESAWLAGDGWWLSTAPPRAEA